METFTKINAVIMSFLLFSCFLYGQEMTPQQKEIAEKIERQNEIEEEKENQIRKKVELDKQKKKQNKKDIEFYWKDGIGLTTNNITQKRDISQYTLGGHIDCRRWGKENKLSVECKKNSLRDFIWQLWTDKKRGYITQSGDSVDASSTAHIFIEPDKKGNWNIVIRIARFQAITGGSYFIDNLSFITSVKRIEDSTNKDGWKLLLNSKSGNTIWELPY